MLIFEWNRMKEHVKDFFKEVRRFISMPKLNVNLMYKLTKDNDPFYGMVTKKFYNMCNSYHPKYKVIPRYRYGIAIMSLTKTWSEYFKSLSGPAQRNYRKALKNECVFKRIEYNDYLDDIYDIIHSTDIRQGEMRVNNSDNYMIPNNDPKSNTTYHDYPYFGVLLNNKLVAIGSCLIAGEYAELTTVYGNVKYQQLGIVPFMVINAVRMLIEEYTNVKYFGYDTYFGARVGMRRFKRKMLFSPFKVRWILGA